jgi:transcriptional regulator with XRE-family HTH domain
MAGNNKVPRGGVKPVDEYVGHRVRLRRQEINISQAALGEAIGVTFQQVQKYERGANRISASTLVAIATSLGVTPGDLIDNAPGSLKVSQPSEGLALLASTIGGVDILRSVKQLRGRRRDAAVAVLYCLADRDDEVADDEEAA